MAIEGLHNIISIIPVNKDRETDMNGKRKKKDKDKKRQKRENNRSQLEKKGRIDIRI